MFGRWFSGVEVKEAFLILSSQVAVMPTKKVESAQKRATATAAGKTESDKNDKKLGGRTEGGKAANDATSKKGPKGKQQDTYIKMLKSERLTWGSPPFRTG